MILIRSRPRAATASSFAALLLAFLSLAACAERPLLSFPWTDSSGNRLGFARRDRVPEGSEGYLEAGAEPCSLALAKPLYIPAGRALAFTVEPVETGKAPRSSIEIELSSGGSGTAAVAKAAFPIFGGPATFYLTPATGIRVALAELRAVGSRLKIDSIATVAAFRGIDGGKSGLRVSSGFSLVRGEGGSTYRISSPFVGLAQGKGAGLLLDYSSAPGGSSMRIDVAAPGARELSFALRCRPSGTRTVLDEGMIPLDADSVSIRLPAGAELRSCFAALVDPKDYELADLGRVLATSPPSSGYSLYRWDLLPKVLVFDFRDYATQDSYLKRLAFYVEKIGYRGRLAKDEELAPLHGWNAHDYRAEDLASFFQAARDKAFPLGAEEKELEGLLLEKGLIVLSGDGSLAAGQGAMISISRESSESLRWTFAVHESTHAIFFVDADYRSYARGLWASLGKDEKWFWKTYLGWAGYDVGSDYLMGNEFQAYLLQQPARSAEEYFSKRKAVELLEKHPELQDKVDAYMKQFGLSFAARAAQLEAWLKAKYGVEAGKTVFLTRSRR
jgi:hypothetical protein